MPRALFLLMACVGFGLLTSVPAQTQEDAYSLPAVPHYELAAPLGKPNEETNQTNPRYENRGTEENPVFVKEFSRERSQEEAEEAREKSKLDRMLADYTGDLAFYTECLFAATLLLAILTGCLAVAAFRQIKAARDSADVTKQAFIAGHRAWLRVDVTLGSNGANISENDASVDICYRIENIGNAPASNVTPHALFVAFKGAAVKRKDLMSEEGSFPFQVQRKECNDLRRKPFDGTGFVIFPNEVWPDVDKISQSQHKIHVGKRDMQRVLEEAGPPGVGLYIVGCVDYTFPSDSTNHHQTRFSYSLGETNVNKTDDLIVITPTYFQASDGNISKDNLTLMPDPFGIGRYAD